jgi:molybdopterin/thiamine biosynthesis adenylyltransferase
MPCCQGLLPAFGVGCTPPGQRQARTALRVRAYPCVHNAAPGAARRFWVRAACLAAGVLGRPVGSVGCWAARPLRALATAPPTACPTSATICNGQL